MTKIYAHRGGAGNAPENTMDAFRLAYESGAHGVELDVHLTKDGKMVVCHDYNIARTTFGSGFIKDMTYDELKNIKAGKNFKDIDKFPNAKIPLLEEVVSFLKDTGMELNVELKASSALYMGIEEKVIELLKKYDMLKLSTISSFDHRALLNVKKIDPSIPVGALYEAYPIKPWEYAKEYGFEYIHPHFFALDKDVVVGCMKEGIGINCWTVNDINMAKQFIMMGINIIITDYPDKLIELVGE